MRHLIYNSLQAGQGKSPLSKFGSCLGRAITVDRHPMFRYKGEAYLVLEGNFMGYRVEGELWEFQNTPSLLWKQKNGVWQNDTHIYVNFNKSIIPAIVLGIPDFHCIPRYAKKVFIRRFP